MEYTNKNALKDINSLLKYFASVDKVFLFLDFDGTLVRIRKNPYDVKLSKKAVSALEKISKNPKILTGVVSGRKIIDLEIFLGDHLSKSFNLFGCHGSEIKFRNENIKIAPEALGSRESIKLIQGVIEKKFTGSDGFIFEKKENSFAVNYRNAKYSEKGKIEDLKNTFLELEKKYPIKLLDLKKVLEIVPCNINKGLAIKETMKKYNTILKTNSHVFICIGDDITDESLFMENINGINIKVGPNNSNGTYANFFLNNIKEVLIFLNKISYIN